MIETGHLYLAVPPLFKIKQGAKHAYALDEKHRDALLAGEFSGRGKVDVQRFKGLGEMNASELKETTMNKAKRRLLRVAISDEARPGIGKVVADLMGSKPEARYKFIQEHAEFAKDLDI